MIPNGTDHSFASPEKWPHGTPQMQTVHFQTVQVIPAEKTKNIPGRTTQQTGCQQHYPSIGD